MEDNNNTPKKRGRPFDSEEVKLAKEQGLIPRSKNGMTADNLLPGDNTRYLTHSLEVMQMPPIKISDVNQVEQRIYDYLALCAKNDMKPTVSGFCNALGVTRTTLFNWRHGEFREDTHQAVICKAYSLLEELWESYMQNGKINPVSGIFLGKNNFGYTDKQEYVVTPNTRTVDPATIEAKYAELPEDE